MPRTRSLAWAELKIGMVAIFAIVMAVILIFLLGEGQGGFFWQRYQLKAKFPNAGGVKSGSPVRVAGVDVGSVRELRFVGAEVEMDLELSEDMQDRVRTDSRATIGSVSLLGEGAVDITATTTGQPIPEGGYIPAGPAAGQLSDVTTQAAKGIEQLTELITDVRSGRGTMGQLVTNEVLYHDLHQFVAAAREVTQGIQKGKGTLGELMTNPATAKQLEASMRNLATVTERLNKGEGSLGQLLKDDAFAKSLTSVTTNFDSLATKLNSGEGTVGQLMNNKALYERMTAVTTQLEQLTGRLNQGQGTAGQLLNDKQLYDNMNQAVTELRNLLTDVRKDPKKFLTVRVSVF